MVYNIFCSQLDTSLATVPWTINTKISENFEDTSLYQHDLKNLVKDGTCFKMKIVPVLLVSFWLVYWDYKKSSPSSNFNDDLLELFLQWMLFSRVLSLIKYYFNVLNKHAPLLKRKLLEKMILFISLNFCGKQFWEGRTLQGFIAKVNL